MIYVDVIQIIIIAMVVFGPMFLIVGYMFGKMSEEKQVNKSLGNFKKTKGYRK